MSTLETVEIERVYARYGTLVLRRCRALLRDDALAEDALQDVFLRLLKRQAPLESRGLASLLYQMATQVSLNRLRTLRRRPEDQGELVLAAIAQAPSPEAALGVRTLLGRVFRQESPSTQVMAVMHYCDGLTLAEVAEATGLSVSGVRKRLRQLRAQLPVESRDELGELGGMPE